MENSNCVLIYAKKVGEEVYEPLVDYNYDEGNMYIPHWSLTNILRAQEEGKKYTLAECVLIPVSNRTYRSLCGKLEKIEQLMRVGIDAENIKNDVIMHITGDEVPQIDIPEFVRQNGIMYGGDTVLMDVMGLGVPVNKESVLDRYYNLEEEDEYDEDDEEYEEDDEDEDYNAFLYYGC